MLRLLSLDLLCSRLVFSERSLSILGDLGAVSEEQTLTTYTDELQIWYFHTQSKYL